MSLRLTEYDSLPAGFLDLNHQQLKNLLGGPSLIHLPGENPQPLFISTLLHGNETTGFEALQKILKRYQHQPLPRAVSIFIGNVDAAQENQRRLAAQPDYNRVWPGGELEHTPEGQIMQQVIDSMAKRKPFASIDIHNNTGKNPHYGCINQLSAGFLTLADMFSDTIVYFQNPRGVQSMAFAELCPAVTLECGQSHDSAGEQHAENYIENVLNLSHLPEKLPEPVTLYHTVVRVTIPETIEFAFGEDATLNLDPEIENHNFTLLQQNERIGYCKSANVLTAWNDAGKDVSNDYFDFSNGEIRLKKAVMPSMLTVNQRAIRQDCLCYLMERYPLPEGL